MQTVQTAVLVLTEPTVLKLALEFIGFLHIID